MANGAQILGEGGGLQPQFKILWVPPLMSVVTIIYTVVFSCHNNYDTGLWTTSYTRCTFC